MHKKWIKYSCWGLTILGLAYLLRPPDLKIQEQPYSAIINDSNGQLLSAHIASDEQWRLPVVDSVASRFAQAIIEYEDKRFYHHLGVDIIALGRAIYDNISQDRIVSGASTISMQLARLTYNQPPRTYPQKVKEIILALRYEIWHSKEDILRWYVSSAPYGGNVVGLSTASWRYYGKSPDQLTWAEASTLAVLPNAPSLIHVNRNRSLLKIKRDKLLSALLVEEQIDSLTYELSIAEPLPNRLYNLPRKAPHLLAAQDKLPVNSKLSINRTYQETATEVLNRYHQEWSQNEIQNGGVLIIDTKTGDILSYVGNATSTQHESAVDMVLAKRSSGSILKPFLYAAMLDEGFMSPRSIVKDIPVYIDGFSPSNYDGQFSGYVHADNALQRSLNIPAVLMLREYGIDIFLSKLENIGFTTLDRGAGHYGLSLILGGGEVTLWELAHAYRNLALCTIEQANYYSPGAAYATLETLKELRRPDEEGNWKKYETSIPIAWKTGTSYGHRDAWAVGVTPEITIATWVGNADGEGRNGIIGTKLAGKLLFGILNNLNTNNSWFDPPFEYMQWNYICYESGDLASPNCTSVDTVYSPIIKTNLKNCKYHTKIIIDSNSKKRITQDCADNYNIETKSYFKIDPITAQYYKSNHPTYEPIPPTLDNCKNIDAVKSIKIKYPTQGDRIYIPKDLNKQKQSLIMEAAHINPKATIYWYLDETFIGSTTEWHTMSIAPKRGPHNITLVDNKGKNTIGNFTIVNSR